MTKGDFRCSFQRSQICSERSELSTHGEILREKWALLATVPETARGQKMEKWGSVLGIWPVLLSDNVRMSRL